MNLSMMIIDLIIVTLAVGFIFARMLRDHGDLSYLRSVLIGSLIAFPAIVLHELGHYLAAGAYGISATFHAAYPWLGLGVLLAAFTRIIFVVPAYVTITGSAGHLAFMSAALAGPAVNGILALGSYVAGRFHGSYVLQVSARLNLVLFICNILPIPGFDGFIGLKHLLYLFA